jgi:hypothetical protein
LRIARSSDVSGDRPMQIFWTLSVALPLATFAAFSVLKAGK